MAKTWVITMLLVTAAPAAVAANDSLSDFSNDFATDLGPLLALFGDAMTKQYLSESTSFLDYLIFAMAPIGIITAIVSTIRVCGHSSLRAFVGRSQEGDGVIEAELCTSTSRDVCELFNRGGIARVLGRPSILELVYDPSRASSATGNSEGAELHLSRKYFEEINSSDDWERVNGSVFERTSKKKALAEEFAPNANLSLNVGIIKQPKWVFIAIAATGVILQAGVLILAGVGVWMLKWNLNDARDSASKNYAPSMFISGTVVMCAGMWACAYLIGQTTREVRFRRRGKKPGAELSRLFWLQPGPQVIGDQNFDPYGYVEDTNLAPHELWMTSRKHFNERLFEMNTVIAISAVTIGYIAQFIGLRGMKAWVALAQLAITLVMSLLRGCLRMQRLGKESNQLGDIPDLVSGHELDWLSFKIAQQKCKWHITGVCDAVSQPASDIKESAQGSKYASHNTKSDITGAPLSPDSNAPTPPYSDSLETPDTKTPILSTSQVTEEPKTDDIQHLLRIRKRLAHLTGHNPLEELSSSEYQQWKDNDIKVRVKAKQIANAICRIAEKASLKSHPSEINLRIQAASHKINSEGHSSQFIDILLRQFYPSSQSSWTIDASKIEAILGLWVWTMTYDAILQKDADASQHAAKKVLMERIVSASPDDRGWSGRASKAQAELNLWLGPSAVKFHNKTLLVDAQECYSFASLWRSTSKDDTNKEACWENLADDAKVLTSRLHRFCGWTSVHQADREPQTGRKLRVQLMELGHTQKSLLDVCAQELFTTLIMSLTSLLTFGEAIIVESAGTARLENPVVDMIAKEFVESGLGSYSEALFGIIPALKGILWSPSPRQLLALVIETAENYRRNQEWNRADTLLRWVTSQFSSAGESHGVNFEQVAREFEKRGILDEADQFVSSPALKTQPKILAAHYGGKDVTILAKWQFCHGEEIVIPTHEIPFIDPWFNTRKSLSVIYRFDDGEIRGVSVPERADNRTFRLTVDRTDEESEKAVFVAANHLPPVSAPVHIHSVIWGLEQIDDKEVYDKLYDVFATKKTILLNNNFFKKDGWFGIQKSAAIIYSFNGTMKCISGREDTRLMFAY
ncbi:hypothetical protein G7Z17_g3546 [Cylindrodendrum hubeiense]|uniref:Uncharacterized protein n=1 Tax=Cylindrodendrum hubeiense TaxID=595255 RepID=A0A9P5HEG8_9HYPO|nr:hypothetical protein G7Z17_g3546 [Cylindrodendrum hubeiense]